MGRVENSMALLRSSWGVLRQDKELTLIPVVSAVCTIVVMAVMGLGVWATIERVPASTTSTGLTTGLADSSYTQYRQTPLTYVVVVLGYILMSFVVTYFAAVLMAGAHDRLSGGEPSLGRAFARASNRLPQLFGWAVINATVGMVLRAIAERAGFLGQILASTLSFAWNVLSWLAVPFIVIDGVGPFAALKGSAEALKKTWGENIIANIGFGIVNFIVMLGAIALGVLFVAIGLPIVGIALAVVIIAVSATILAALTGIYRTALFMYASHATVPQGFDPQLLQGAFRAKRLGGLV